MELFSPQARARLSLKRWWWQSKVDWDEDDVYDVNQDVDKDEDEVDNDREKMFVDKDDEDVWHEVYDDGDELNSTDDNEDNVTNRNNGSHWYSSYCSSMDKWDNT